MRRKPWARPELAACPFVVDNPMEQIGHWADVFPKKQEIHLELGCGKGSFISQIAARNPQINYIAVDIKSEMLGLAKRKTEAAFDAVDRTVDNVFLMSQDIERIHLMLSPQDIISRIYINFCNPWPKDKQKKKRLTHSKQLSKYKEFLAQNGELHFKTDDEGLFDDTLEYLKETGFEVVYLTRDLHNSGYEHNISTEHEDMFSSKGITIKFLIARKGTA